MGFLCAAILCLLFVTPAEHVSEDAAASAKRLYASGRYTEARAILENACQQARKMGDSELPALLNNLGEADWSLGRLLEAQHAFQQSLALRKSAGDTTSVEVARTLNNLGIVYKDLNFLTKAEDSLTRAAALQESLAGASSVEVANTWLNLGTAYKAEGRLTEAEAIFRKSLAVSESGNARATLALGLNNLGVLLRDRGGYVEAERVLTRALDVWQADLGPSHPLVASALNNLGVLYTNTQRLNEAEASFRRAISIGELSLPADHPNLAAYRLGYACVLRKMDRKKEARQLEDAAHDANARYMRQNALGATVDTKSFLK